MIYIFFYLQHLLVSSQENVMSIGPINYSVSKVFITPTLMLTVNHKASFNLIKKNVNLILEIVLMDVIR